MLADGDVVMASMVCVYSKPQTDRSVRSVTTTSGTESVNPIDSELFDTNSTVVTETCPTEHHSCYTLWQYNPIDPTNASLYTILAKGCWDTSPDMSCQREQCYSSVKPTGALNNTRFCCCYGPLCNANISAQHYLNSYQPLQSLPRHTNEKLESFQNEENMSNKAVLMACMAALVSVLLIGLGFTICCRALSSSVMAANTKHKNSDSLHLLESNSSSTQSSSLLCDLENLKLIEEIGRGRYGSVWKGILDDKTVAVKKFGPQHRDYYLNEKDIYLLSFMEFSHSLPRLLGFQEICSDGRPEYHLVLSYAPLGCLQDYLRNNTIDWLTLCKMIQTVTQGLAYLHSEVNKGDRRKPCVAHRDLSSRNILIKADNTCMICDFQFAIRISGSEYYSCGERFDSQTASLNDVGTLRYMAPEILEGAVNLRDCESAMKQIDVYALGLVLWESASRCSDLYQGIEVPNYKQPFEKELGLHPTFEQMQVMVTRHKARPLFPDIWKDSNPAIRSLKETIEDCWDHDADARLTALCVEERLFELPLLWDRYKSGTITNCVAAIYSSRSTQSVNSNNNRKNGFRIHSANNNYHNIIGGNSGALPLEHNDKLTNELQTSLLINRLEYPNHNTIHNNHNNNNINNNSNINDVNEDSLSPSSDFEKNIISAANAFKNQPKLTLPLQPHQGRNPCLERNLMLQSSDDNTSALLEHGFKFQMNHSNSDPLFADVFNESNTNNESNDLLSNDLLNRTIHDNTRNVSRRPPNGLPPIPYVQNAVGSNAIPKQHNVASNGQSVHLKKTNETLNVKTKSESSFSKLFNWSNIKALKVWPNIRILTQRSGNSDKCLVGEREPFTRNNSALSAPLAVKIEDSLNIRPVSNSLISHSLSNQISDTEVSASTQPKVTQIDLVNGSPLINVITNDKSNHKVISNQFNVLIERPSNLERINGFNSATTESCDCSETNFKESSVKCDSS
ncbi:unnamed protein product [Oppiella nova]|uniref:receptor protein serine/threonine kinase n=1 Tax=Oppiella nova TaxID=334625 RepID=A0A7R9M050_9ACAR|nr:unnamed protein product [Oppiella nova]CAG2168047.1 unnamed protein product [Oppiella nova]